MTDKPFPSTEAVDVLAGALYEVVSKQGGGLRDLDNAPVAWADVPTRLKFHQRSMALDTLAAAYPQIVADVLRAQALDWENACADDVKAPCRCSEAMELRDRADEVLA